MRTRRMKELTFRRRILSTTSLQPRESIHQDKLASQQHHQQQPRHPDGQAPTFFSRPSQKSERRAKGNPSNPRRLRQTRLSLGTRINLPLPRLNPQKPLLLSGLKPNNQGHHHHQRLLPLPPPLSFAKRKMPLQERRNRRRKRFELLAAMWLLLRWLQRRLRLVNFPLQFRL